MLSKKVQYDHKERGHVLKNYKSMSLAHRKLKKQKEGSNMKLKQWIAAILAGGALFSLAACGGGTASGTDADGGAAATSGDTADGGEKRTVGIVLKTLNSEYWNCMAAGIEQAKQDFGCDVVLQGPASETSYDEQLSMIETMMSSGIEAIVIAPLQPDTAAQQVANASIPVLAVDTTFNSDNLQSYIGVSNENAAAEGGKYIAEKIGAGCKVVILGGVQSDLTSEDRIKGWTQGVESAGGSILATQYTDAATDKAVTAMEAFLLQYPKGEIDAVVCHSDDVAMGAANAIAQAGRDEIQVVGFGGISGAKPVKAGTLTATVDIGPYEMGYTAVQKALEAIDGKPVDAFIDTGATVIDAENVDEYLVKLDEWTK